MPPPAGMATFRPTLFEALALLHAAWRGEREAGLLIAKALYTG
jgi:hypothetical protein